MKSISRLKRGLRQGMMRLSCRARQPSSLRLTLRRLSYKLKLLIWRKILQKILQLSPFHRAGSQARGNASFLQRFLSGDLILKDSCAFPKS